MGELSKFTDDDELAPGEGEKSSKNKDRWVRPPFVRSSPESVSETKEVPPPAPPPPGLLERVLGKDLFEKKEDDKDGEDEEESEGEEKSVEASESSEEPAAEVTEGEPAPLSQAAEAELAEAVEQAAAEGEQTPVEKEFDETVLHIHREPDGTVSEYIPAAEDEETSPQQVTAAAGGFGASPPPPPPPIVPPPAAGFPNQGPTFNWNMAPPSPNLSYNTAPSPQISVEQHRSEIKETERDAEKRGLRRGLVAGFITGYVLKAYLANRKRERYEKATEKQLNQRDEQINQMQREQQTLAEQMAARAEDYRLRQEAMAKNQSARFEGAARGVKPEAAPQPQEARDGEQLFDQEGNEIILQPGWRVERSAGGYSVVLDEHNRVVHDAIRYGEAFKREQQREQLSEDLFAAVGGGAAVPAPSDDHFVSPQFGPVSQPQQQPGSILPPPQRKEVDLQHRLPEPRNQLIATVASPWLWTAIALLIIVYFIAALA